MERSICCFSLLLSISIRIFFPFSKLFIKSDVYLIHIKKIISYKKVFFASLDLFDIDQDSLEIYEHIYPIQSDESCTIQGQLENASTSTLYYYNLSSWSFRQFRLNTLNNIGPFISFKKMESWAL